MHRSVEQSLTEKTERETCPVAAWLTGLGSPLYLSLDHRLELEVFVFAGNSLGEKIFRNLDF